MTQCVVLSGNIRKDHFGRIVVDGCDSDLNHLQNATAKPGEDRAKCRNLLEQYFEKYIGLKGRLSIEISFRPEIPEDPND